MERPLDIGDLAVVTIGRFSKEYTIIGVDARGIFIGDATSPSLLVQGRDKKWIVYGLNQPHSVAFTPPILGIPVVNDAMRTIMLKLDYKSLMAFCKTNKTYAALCDDDNFWAQKNNQDYPGSLQFRTSDVTFKQQYENLSYADGDMYRALTQGHEYVLDYLYSLGKYSPISFGDYFSLITKANAPLSTFIWLATYDPKNIPSGEDIANLAAIHNRLDLLQWMARLKQPRLPHGEGNLGREIIRRGKDETLRWLVNNMPHPQILLNAAVAENRVDILRKFAIWAPHVRPSHGIITDVSQSINYDTLMYLTNLTPPFNMDSDDYYRLKHNFDPRIRAWAGNKFESTPRMSNKLPFIDFKPMISRPSLKQ
jgi:hypothetical protein